jgi:hypothetical protein
MGRTDTCFNGGSSISCIVRSLEQTAATHACMHVLPTSMQKDNPFTLSCAFLRWWRHLPPRWQQLMRRDPVTGATSSSGPVWGCPYRWERARGGSRRQLYCTCPFCAACHLQEVVCCLVDTGIMQRACSSQQGCFCHWSFAAHVRAKVDGAVTYMYDQPANALSPAPPTSWHSQHPAPALSSLSPANLLIWLHRWGANCILYKHDKVTRKGQPILDWPDLLQPQLKGQVAFPTSTREFIGCALKTLGVPGIGWNSTAADLEAAGVSREAARDAVRALRGQAKLFSDNDHVRALQVMSPSISFLQCTSPCIATTLKLHSLLNISCFFLAAGGRCAGDRGLLDRPAAAGREELQHGSAGTDQWGAAVGGCVGGARRGQGGSPADRALPYPAQLAGILHAAGARRFLEWSQVG